MKEDAGVGLVAEGVDEGAGESSAVIEAARLAERDGVRCGRSTWRQGS